MSWRACKASELLDREDGDGAGDPIGRLRRAALLADVEGDLKTAIDARNEIVSEASSVGADFDLVIAFAWLLQMARRRPDLVHPESLMWEYKWVVEHLAGLVAVSASAVDRITDDLEREYAKCGLDSSAAALLRVKTAISMRRRDQLPGLFDAWSRNEDGAGADCAACRRHARVTYFTALGDDERAFVEAGPILEGKMGCGEVPELTYGHVVTSLLRLGRVEDAVTQAERGIQTLEGEPILSNLGPFLRCLALAGRQDEGMELFASWLRRALSSRNDIVRFEFFRGAAALFRAADAASQRSVYLVLPPTFDIFEPDGTYDVGTLRGWLDTEVEQLAARFDRRHGNDGYARDLEDDRRMLG